eukprot:325292-Amphidinium_carterae.1
MPSGSFVATHQEQTPSTLECLLRLGTGCNGSLTQVQDHHWDRYSKSSTCKRPSRRGLGIKRDMSHVDQLDLLDWWITSAKVPLGRVLLIHLSFTIVCAQAKHQLPRACWVGTNQEYHQTGRVNDPGTSWAYARSQGCRAAKTSH